MEQKIDLELPLKRKVKLIMANIVILGAGGFGIALSISALQSGNKSTLWTKFEAEEELLKAERESKKLLPGVKIPEEIEITRDLEVLKTADIAIIAVPSHVVREICIMMAKYINPKAIVVCVSKGFEEVSLKTMSQIAEEELKNIFVALSGPSHAEEVAKNIPTALVAASTSKESAEFVQDALSNSTLRIYTSSDVMGVELGGALKNIIALAVGALDGLGLGDNTMAALITRGITEISRLGEKCGANLLTFAGLSGIGDLVVTCTSLHSRNRRFGKLIGMGKSSAVALEEVGMTVEGYKNTKNAYELALRHDVEMPIITEVYRTLYEDKPVGKVIYDLMGRPSKHESEDSWLTGNE